MRNTVGDFGLATSSLAAVDPSDVSPHVIAPEADMTLGTYGSGPFSRPELMLSCSQRWARDCTSPRKSSQGNAVQGITTRLICIVLEYVVIPV